LFLFESINSDGTVLRLHDVDIAMIKFVDESGSINCCLCAVGSLWAVQYCISSW